MKVGRNSPCPCGSGKKYKECCARKAGGTLTPASATMVPPAFPAAFSLHQAGYLEQAETAYRGIISSSPRHFDALHMLGVLLYQSGRAGEAIEYFERAIKLQPNFADAHNNLGLAYSALRRFEEAIGCFERALALNRNFAMAHCNLGLVRNELGDTEAAISSFTQAIVLKPDYLEARFNLAGLYRRLGRAEQAIAEYQAALRINPTLSEAENILGNLLKEAGEPEQARAHYQNALRVRPEYYEAHINLGVLNHDQGRLDEADACLQQALALRPKGPEALYHLGNNARDRQQLAKAREYYLDAIEAAPDYFPACFDLAWLSQQVGWLGEAQKYYQQALALDADFFPLQSNYVAFLNYLPEETEASLYEAHRQLAHRYADHLAPSEPLKPQAKNASRRLRIGYLSPDFRSHSVAYFIEGILAHHDHNHFEIACYYNHSVHDTVTQRLQRHAGIWRDVVSLEDRQLVELIRQDQVDILVDLCGLTAGNRWGVFARRAAPLQVNYLGYPNTSGLNTMDYRLTDAWADPLGESDPYYTEKLLRLQRGFFCYRPPAGAPEVGPLPATKNGAVTFGVFNSLMKLPPSLLALYARVLKALPAARLTIQTQGLDEELFRSTLIEAFTREGVEANRLLLLGRTSLEEHLALHNQVDIVLDSYPWNGHTSSCHALWMGVPVLSLQGKRHASRLGASALTRVGLEEWLCGSEEEYAAKAIKFASDRAGLERLRSELRDRVRAGLVDTAAEITHEIEQCYLDMWQQASKQWS